MLDLNIGIDIEIAEVVSTTTYDNAPIYKVWNNVTKRFANNGKHYCGLHTARNEARRICNMYSGVNNLQCV